MKFEMEMYAGGLLLAQAGADTAQPALRMTMHVTDTVVEVSGDTVTVRQVVDSVAAASPALPTEGPAAEEGLGEILGMRTVMRTTTRGRPVSVEVIGGPPGAAAGFGGMGGFGAPGAAAPGQSQPVVLPEHPVRVGDTWSDSLDLGWMVGAMAGEGAGAPRFTGYARSTYRLERLETRRGALIAVVSSSTTMLIDVAGLMTMTMGMTGETELNLSLGVHSAGRSSASGQMVGPMGEIPMRMEVRMTRLE